MSYEEGVEKQLAGTCLNDEEKELIFNAFVSVGKLTNSRLEDLLNWTAGERKDKIAG